MVRWLVAAALRLRFLVVGIAVILAVLGVAQLRNQPTDVLPEVSAPYAEIQTEALGLSAEEVEQMITVPLEADLLNGVAWLQSIESASVTGLSSIVLTFEPGTDVIRARQMVQERLTQSHGLPNVSKPPVLLQPLSTVNRLGMIGMSSSQVSLIDMSVLARWVIRPRLMGVPGVANVAVWGLRDRQLQVLVDPERLSSRDVKLWDVVKATGEALWVSPLTFLNSSTPGTGGFIDTPNQRLGVRHVLPVSTPSDLGRIAVSGTPWLLDDVSQVVEGHQPLIGDAIINGAPGVVLVVEKFPWADTVSVTRDVEAAMAAMRPGLSGIAVDTTLFRPASYIEAARGNIALSLAIGLLVALVLLVVLLRNVLRALVAAAALIVSLGVALWVLTVLGATMNAMALMGLLAAVAAIVGHAVMGASGGDVIAGPDGAPGDAAARRPVPAEVIAAVTYGTVITLLVLVPVMAVGGVTGALLGPLAVAYAVAILASALVAFTVTPALCSLLLARRRKDVKPVAERPTWPVRVHRRVVEGLMPRSAVLLGASALLAVAGVVGSAWLRPGLVPALHEQDVVVSLAALPGTSHPEMVRVVQRVGSELEALPGVDTVTAQVGRAVTGDEVVDVNGAKLWVRLASGARQPATMAAIREIVAGYAGLDHRVTTYLADRMERAVAGPARDLIVRVYGDDLALLQRTATEVANGLDGVEGLHDVTLSTLPAEPAIGVRVDLAAAQRYGLKPGDVRRAATSLVNGIQVGSVFEAQKVFDVVIRGQPQVRDSPSDISGLLIDTPTGSRVRLDAVADVSVRGAPAIIRRDAVSRYLDVAADVRGRRVGAVVDDVGSMLAAMSFPLEFRAELLTPASQRQGLALRLIAMGLGIAVAVLLLLQAAFGSWRLAAIGLLLLLGGASGGVAALLISGGDASLAALAGFLAVFALGVGHLLTLVRRAQIEEGGGTGDRAAAALRASETYAAPILASAAMVAAIVLALLVVGARPGIDVLQQTATVVLGAVITTTALVLIGVPVAYGRYGRAPADELATWPAQGDGNGRSQDAAP